MIIIKERCESLELNIFRSLSRRKQLSSEDQRNYEHLEKGYVGEKWFDAWIIKNVNTGILLADLLFKTNHSHHQTDTLLITPDKLYLFEIKNNEGDYSIDGEKWSSASHLELKNPLLQLKRNESLFRRLLQEQQFSIPSEAYMVFVNPDFHLYHSSPEQPILFLSQLNRFAAKLNKKTLPLKNFHTKLAEKLVSLHLTKSPYTNLPEYRYEQLQKGMICAMCGKFYSVLLKKNCVCFHCGGKEDYKLAVLRNTEEFRMLFPDKSVTVQQIFEWCSIIKHKNTIRNVLRSSYKKAGEGRNTVYIP